MVISASTLLGLDDEPGMLGGYGAIPSEVLHDILNNSDSTGVTARLRELFCDPADGRLVAMDSTARCFTGGLRSFALWRDQDCRLSGGRIADVDHIDDHRHGGPTAAANGQGLGKGVHIVKDHPAITVRALPPTLDASDALNRLRAHAPDIEWTMPTGGTPTRGHPHPRSGTAADPFRPIRVSGSGTCATCSHSPDDRLARVSEASPFDEVIGRSAYALIRFGNDESVTLLAGERADVERIADVPIEQGNPATGRRFDRLVAIPYRQVRERGFAAVDDGTPLSSITIDHESTLPLDEALTLLPDQPPVFADRGGFEIPDADYEQVVAAVIRDEIGAGEGANLVIGRTWRAQAQQFGHNEAMTVWRRLLERERGAYWTFCAFTGDRWLIGASPERHISLDAGQVRMNPISGTFRLRGLDTGADDYLTKPFSPKELVARAGAVLRRVRPALAAETLGYSGLEMDLGAHRVKRDTVPVQLGPTEYRLLRHFLENPGRVFSRQQLLETVWPHSEDIELRTVDVHIRRLRLALGEPDIVRTVRSAGYALDAEGLA